MSDSIAWYSNNTGIKMMQRILWVFLLIFAAGCTLAQDDPDDQVPVRTTPERNTFVDGDSQDAEAQPTLTLRPTSTIAPSTTPVLMPTSTIRRVQPAQYVPNCIPRNDWPLYGVVRGDTLASIARRVGSSTNDLTSANCLGNPDLIANGQQLRVPRLPSPVQPPPVQPLPPSSTISGYVSVYPYINYTASGYTVQPNTLLTLNWSDARRDATRIDFFQARNGLASLVGSDFTPSDGASVTWTAPASAETLLYATAYLANNGQQSTIGPVRIVAGNTVPPVDPGSIYIAPYARLEGDRYIVANNVALTLTWPNAPTTQSSRVDFYLAPSGAGSALILLGTDSYMPDGASVSYTPRGGMEGSVYASALRTNGTLLNSRSVQISTEAQSRVQGNVVVSPYISTDGQSYALTPGAVVTLSWPEVPSGESSQVEFTLVTESGAYTSLGLDTNLSNGASVQWTVPPFTRGSIYAAAPLPGQNHAFVESRRLAIFTQDVPDVDPSIGRVVASPIVREDSGAMVLQVGAAVTLTWPEAPAGAQRVEFYLTPTGTGIPPATIGTDGNLSDGAVLAYTVPSNLLGYFSARAFFSNGSTSETETSVMMVSE